MHEAEGGETNKIYSAVYADQEQIYITGSEMIPLLHCNSEATIFKMHLSYILFTKRVTSHVI